MLFAVCVLASHQRAPHVTPLTFRANINQQNGRRQRRLLGNANRVHGDLSSLGYFSADVCLGTPAISFDLILDTGSSMTALPCSGCLHCGTHMHGSVGGKRYSEASSTSGSVVSCNDETCPSRRCTNGQCAYSISYTEGSRVRGHMVRDTFWLASAEGARVAVPHVFGCQEYESGLFYSQVADGISGFEPASHTLFASLRAATGASDMFSMCLSEKVGAMVLGGRLPAASNSWHWIPMGGMSSFNVALVDITVDGASIGCPASSYRSTIIDSGTTFTYLPPQAYRPVRDRWRSTCPWGSCASRVEPGEYPDDYCYRMGHDDLDQFAPYTLRMANGVSVPFGPRQYAYELRSGVWCLGVFDNDHNGAAIGSAAMRNFEVVFDLRMRRIAFVPSDCEGMHGGSQASMLQGGYGLAGCAAAERPPPPPPPQPIPRPPAPLSPRPPAPLSPRPPALCPPPPPSPAPLPPGDERPPFVPPSPSPSPPSSTLPPPLPSTLSPARSPPAPATAGEGEGSLADGAIPIDWSKISHTPSSNGRGRERGNSTLNALYDEVDLLAHTVSAREFFTTLERLHPGIVGAIAVSSSLLVLFAALCLCAVRRRMLRMRKEFEERLRLVSATQELSVFDDADAADDAAALAVEGDASTPVR